MSALRRIKKVKGGYEVTVSCSNKPTEERVYRTYAQCEKFADEYFIDYLGVALNSIHHPEGDGVELEGLNPDSLETIDIEIPMNERIKELALQAGLEELSDSDWCSLNHPDVRAEHLERFAELVRDDERKGCAEHYLGIMRDAVCCGDYEKCIEPCTPKGEWLAKKELAKPEQSNYSDIVSDGGLDPRNKFDAQPEQEPVAWMVRDQVDGCRYPSALKNPAGSINGESQPLYTAPPRKEWVGLTEEEIKEVLGLNETSWSLSGVALQHVMDDARALEAKLKEKNDVRIQDIKHRQILA